MSANLLAMIPPDRRSPWTRFALGVLALGLLLGATGCYSIRNETWHCYDDKGQPVEGVLIICNYGLANYGKRAVNHRFSDAQGRIILDFDEDTPRELMRGYDYIYSSKLRSGSVGIGERWHQGAPIPGRAVYFDEYNNNIYIKGGASDPLIWGGALNGVLSAYSWAFHSAGYVPGRDAVPGLAKLKESLEVLAPRERALFLAQYGEKTVPVNEINQRGLRGYFVNLPDRDNPNLKFKDIIIQLPTR